MRTKFHIHAKFKLYISYLRLALQLGRIHSENTDKTHIIKLNAINFVLQKQLTFWNIFSERALPNFLHVLLRAFALEIRNFLVIRTYWSPNNIRLACKRTQPTIFFIVYFIVYDYVIWWCHLENFVQFYALAFIRLVLQRINVRLKSWNLPSLTNK